MTSHTHVIGLGVSKNWIYLAKWSLNDRENDDPAVDNIRYTIFRHTNNIMVYFMAYMTTPLMLHCGQ